MHSNKDGIQSLIPFRNEVLSMIPCADSHLVIFARPVESYIINISAPTVCSIVPCNQTSSGATLFTKSFTKYFRGFNAIIIKPESCKNNYQEKNCFSVSSQLFKVLMSKQFFFVLNSDTDRFFFNLIFFS